MKYSFNLKNSLNFLSFMSRTPLWSSGQEFLVTDSEVRIRFLVLPHFPTSSGFGTGSTLLREYAPSPHTHRHKHKHIWGRGGQHSEDDAIIFRGVENRQMYQNLDINAFSQSQYSLIFITYMAKHKVGRFFWFSDWLHLRNDVRLRNRRNLQSSVNFEYSSWS
jgi:hypothetical protein